MKLRHGKSPTQRRSIERVGRVLDSAALTLGELGFAKTTTNHIATRAGVHVPSVYQYFANKEAIVAELWDAHVGELIDLLDSLLVDGLSASIESIARRYVTRMLKIHAARPELLEVLYAEAPRLDGVRNLRDEASARLLPFLQARSAELRPDDLVCAAFVLAAAVEGVARQAVASASLGAPPTSALVSELTHLVTAYLGASS